MPHLDGQRLQTFCVEREIPLASLRKRLIDAGAPGPAVAFLVDLNSRRASVSERTVRFLCIALSTSEAELRRELVVFDPIEAWWGPKR
jgi:hypothetical protein